MSQFDNKKPEELESEFDNFDADTGFSLDPLDMGGFVPPHMGGITGEIIWNIDIHIIGGPNFDRLYHKLKVLFLLLLLLLRYNLS